MAVHAYTDEQRMALIERRVVSAANHQHIEWAQRYLTDVRFLAGRVSDEIDARLSLERQLEMEREATHANFVEWQRAQDECDSLRAELMLLKRRSP